MEGERGGGGRGLWIGGIACRLLGVGAGEAHLGVGAAGGVCGRYAVDN